MTPIEKIVKNRDLIALVMEHEYLPQARNGQFGEIVDALQEMKAITSTDFGCSSCVREIIRIANAHIVAFDNEAQLKKKTFDLVSLIPKRK